MQCADIIISSVLSQVTAPIELTNLIQFYGVAGKCVENIKVKKEMYKQQCKKGSSEQKSMNMIA